jgi:hypothetical protein
MTSRDDLSGDMSRFPSSAEADRLLDGRLPPDDLPTEAASLARLLHDLEPVAVNDELAERRIVSAMLAEIARNPASATPPSSLRSKRSRVPVKAGALAFAAVLGTATAAAAANGSLPPGIQRAVSDALSHVSISVPRPAPHHTEPVESPHGGTDGPRNGGSPVGETGPVSPRGVQNGKDDGSTPRGATKPTHGATGSGGPTGATGPTGTNGRRVGPPSTVPHGPGTTNPNKGSGNNAGQHNATQQGQDIGAAKGKRPGQSSAPTTTVPTGNGNVKVQGNGDAGGNGNAPGNGRAKVQGNGNADGS